jgi:hypothetical protein
LTATVNKNQEKSRWEVVAGISTAAIALGGSIVYGLLTLAYSQFYGALGVDPQDVGLSFANTLARLAG